MKKVFSKTGQDFVNGKTTYASAKDFRKELKAEYKKKFAALLEREHFVNLVDDFHVILKYLSKDAKDAACVEKMFGLLRDGASPKEVFYIMEGKYEYFEREGKK